MPTSLEVDGSQRVIGAIDACRNSIHIGQPSWVKCVAQDEHSGMIHRYLNYDLIGLVPQYCYVGARLRL